MLLVFYFLFLPFQFFLPLENSSRYLFSRYCVTRFSNTLTAVQKFRTILYSIMHRKVGGIASFTVIINILETINSLFNAGIFEMFLRRIPLNVRAISAKNIYQKTTHSTVTF